MLQPKLISVFFDFYLEGLPLIRSQMGSIVDVYSSDDGEWCKIIDDTVIRLDQIENFELD